MKRYPLPSENKIEQYLSHHTHYTETAKDYINNPHDYVREITTVVNGKLRHLVTYQSSSKGGELRRLHSIYAKFLCNHYKSAKSSFAYIKGKSFVDCVNCHKNGTVFLKADIHSYFDSISLKKMLDRIHKLNCKRISTEVIDLFTQACFYEGHLPIGFVSSPALSDLFLVDLDRKYQRYKKFVYTRYADDFIISASGDNAVEILTKLRQSLMNDLEELDLELNRKKTYIRQLSNAGDAIRLLGINLVRTVEEANKVTVSDRYLRRTCFELGQVLSANVPDNELYTQISKVCGMISFIKQCSDSSYKKFKKYAQIKCQYSGNFDIASIQSSVKIS